MEINCTYAKNDIRIIMAWTTGHCVLLRHLVIMKIKEHNMCRMCGEGQETPLHILHDCPATLGHRVAWEARMTNPEHAKRSTILNMTEKLLFFTKEPRIAKLMTRENEQAVLMLAHPRRLPTGTGLATGNPVDPEDPQDQDQDAEQGQGIPGDNIPSSPSMVSSDED